MKFLFLILLLLPQIARAQNPVAVNGNALLSQSNAVIAPGDFFLTVPGQGINTNPILPFANAVPQSQVLSLLSAANSNLNASALTTGAVPNSVLAPGYTLSNVTFLPDLLVMSNDTVAPPAGLWAQYLFNSPNPSNFTILGTSGTWPLGGPFAAYSAPPFDQTGGSNTKIQPASTPAIEFGIYSDSFVVRNSGSSLKVLVNGVDNFNVFPVPGGGNEYWTYVIFKSKQARTIMLEGLGYFYSVYIPITNGFLNVQPTRTLTVVMLGDSFTEEDFSTGSKSWGPSTRLAELYPKWNLIALGEGGTGWYNPGIGNGFGQGTNFLGRVADVTARSPNIVIIWGGINDANYCTNTSQTNIVFGNATNVLKRLSVALPGAPIFVIGPQFPRAATAGDQNVFNETNLLGVACGLVSSCFYINPIAEPWITGNVVIPGSGNAVYFTLPSDTTHPTIMGSDYYADRIFGAINGQVLFSFPDQWPQRNGQ